jgi:hypothetical protein
LELDRQSIEKRDFPIGRRGYEPEAVDAHLEALAREVEALKRSARSRSGESLASAASTQVQMIVEAAETSAADIERQADLDATRIRQDAEREAERSREDAIARSREHVSKVGEASATMVQRVDAMESELGALFESLRTGANRLNADLSLLGGNMAELYSAAGSGAPTGTAAAPAPARFSAPPEPADEGDYEDEDEEAVAESDEPAAAPAAAPASAPTPTPAAATGPTAPEDAGDVEGARLIALNMALNGQPREETDRYLAENFELEDRGSLLDEVYAAVGG